MWMVAMETKKNILHIKCISYQFFFVHKDLHIANFITIVSTPKLITMKILIMSMVAMEKNQCYHCNHTASFHILKKKTKNKKIIIYYLLWTGWYVNDACLYPFIKHLSKTYKKYTFVASFRIFGKSVSCHILLVFQQIQNVLYNYIFLQNISTCYSLKCIYWYYLLNITYNQNNY